MLIRPETRIQKLLRKQSTAFLITAIIASLCFVLIGLLIEQKSVIASRILIIFGSSGLGTCFGLVFGSITGASAINRITDLIETTLNSSLNSSEDALEPFRKPWHHYLCTKIEDEYVWRYRVIDFSRLAPSGKLVAVLVVPGPGDTFHTYHLEAFLVGSRLLIAQNAASGTEEPAIGVYPSAADRFRSIICGIVYLQTWDGSQFITAALMSQLPLLEKTPKIGTLPKSTYANLNELWKKEAKLVGIDPLLFKLPDAKN